MAGGGEIEVHPAISVVVKDRHAAAIGGRGQFLRGPTAAVDKSDTSRVRDIAEPDGRSGVGPGLNGDAIAGRRKQGGRTPLAHVRGLARWDPRENSVRSWRR